MEARSAAEPASTEAVDAAPTHEFWADVYTAQQLGEFASGLRRARGLTQTELADELGVTRQYISELERGVPTLYTDRLFSLLRLLGGSLRGRFPA